MDSVGEILTPTRCKVCGRELSWSVGQWRQICFKCGTVIKIPWKAPAAIKTATLVKCFLCMDKGLVFYKAQVGEEVYDYTALCYCEAGQRRPEKGFPAVDKVRNIADLRFIAQENQKKHGLVQQTIPLSETGIESEFDEKELQFS